MVRNGTQKIFGRKQLLNSNPIQKEKLNYF